MADLFTTWVLSASLRMPVSQSGRSPAELVAAAVIPGAGNCVDAGGGTFAPMLKAIVAASGMVGIAGCCACCGYCGCCAGCGVTGRGGRGEFCICWSMNSTCATLSLQPRLRRKPSKAL